MPIPSRCPDCGSPVQPTAPSAGRCGGCGREVYANSRPTAGVLLVRDGAVLLIQRGAEPRLGTWDIPGGFLDEGEHPEQGAVREIAEELGWRLDPRDLRLVLLSINPWPAGDVLDVVYEACAPAGEPTPGDDAAGWAFHPIDALPEPLAFDSTRAVLERWRAQRVPDDHRLQGGRMLPLATAAVVAESAGGASLPLRLGPVREGNLERQGLHLRLRRHHGWRRLL